MTAADVVLYSSIWLSVALFVAGEAGKRQRAVARSAGGWPWLASASGAGLLAIHMALALEVHHAWSHGSVARTVAEQSEAVYGVAWSGGVWMNYAFLVLWVAEITWWRLGPRLYFSRPRSVTILVRAFCALILVNSAVVFAAPSRRIPGGLMIGVLVWVWRDTFSGTNRLPGANRHLTVHTSG